MFDVQRTAIKQSKRAMKRGFAAQQNVNRLALNGFKQQESLQRQSLELAQATTNAYMSLAASMMGTQGSREQRQTVDEAFSRLKDTHSEYFDAVERELDRSVESFDDLSDEYVDAFDQQVDQLLESHQTVEDQTAENFDEFSQLLREQLEQTQEMQDQLEDQFEDQTEQVEELLRRQTEEAEKFQQRLESDAERMQRQLEDQARASRNRSARTEVQVRTEGDGESDEKSGELELVDGLGPTFHDRLNAEGIFTIADLDNAGPERVAEAAEVSEERAQNWIDHASE